VLFTPRERSIGSCQRNSYGVVRAIAIDILNLFIVLLFYRKFWKHDTGDAEHHESGKGQPEDHAAEAEERVHALRRLENAHAMATEPPTPMANA
jgi:hypothetical protein